MIRFRLLPPSLLTCTLSAMLLGGAAHAACDTLAFFPAVTNTYTMKSSGTTSTVTVSNRLSGNSVTSTTTVNGQSNKVVWTCTPAGLSAKLGGTMQMSTGSFPRLSDWKVGYHWNSEAQMAGVGGMKVKSTSVSRIAAIESVTTPAGTFTTYRVETDTTTAMQLPPGSKLPPSMAKAMNRSTHVVAWYAVGVGAIKEHMEDGQFDMLLIKTAK
ncbi:hypothetical protein MF271_08360 [Deinococcus sp. KNUC1210]|uniref:TapB family protein n=1 Tax=Deinococcus sp. KNUC1210 TaxID=2917691 RepID=UPI001EEFF6EB|nr:hypothetical protein [Deinococcus sp. KNUC1210]ULH16572.1 hypothetical protein MF271_08360 [Deinococcus sp. KNUC1210]